MKFALATAFTFVLVMGVQSSVIPLAHHDIALAAPVHIVSAPHVHIGPHGHGSVAVHASAHNPHAISHAVHASALNPHLVSHAVHASALNPHAISHAVHASALNPHLVSHAVHASALNPHLVSHAVHASALNSHLIGAHSALAHAVHAPVHAAHAHIVPAVEGHYIAKTRGAVHKAPLAGHLASAASINLAPAPGTI